MNERFSYHVLNGAALLMLFLLFFTATPALLVVALIGDLSTIIAIALIAALIIAPATGLFLRRVWGYWPGTLFLLLVLYFSSQAVLSKASTLSAKTINLVLVTLCGGTLWLLSKKVVRAALVDDEIVSRNPKTILRSAGIVQLVCSIFLLISIPGMLFVSALGGANHGAEYARITTIVVLSITGIVFAIGMFCHTTWGRIGLAFSLSLTGAYLGNFIIRALIGDDWTYLTSNFRIVGVAQLLVGVVALFLASQLLLNKAIAHTIKKAN